MCTRARRPHAHLPGWSKPQEVSDAICEALKRNFVFKGISDSLLLEVRTLHGRAQQRLVSSPPAGDSGSGVRRAARTCADRPGPHAPPSLSMTTQVVERMYGVGFRAGSVVLQQGALPKPDDCMYFLELGEAEVVISGAVDAQSSKAHGGEERKVDGHTVRIPQKPGWVFGDVALLFHSPRTASVMAKTNIVVWALERKTFLQFVMKHAQGARALRFLRKLPLLKGLSDNDLIRAASRMPQRVYNDGQALVKYGERGDELFLIRYGKVRAAPHALRTRPSVRLRPPRRGRGCCSRERRVGGVWCTPDRRRSGCCGPTATAAAWRRWCWAAGSLWASAPSSTTACAAPTAWPRARCRWW